MAKHNHVEPTPEEEAIIDAVMPRCALSGGPSAGAVAIVNNDEVRVGFLCGGHLADVQTIVSFGENVPDDIAAKFLTPEDAFALVEEAIPNLPADFQRVFRAQLGEIKANVETKRAAIDLNNQRGAQDVTPKDEGMRLAQLLGDIDLSQFGIN